MNANELADKLSQYGEGAAFANIKLTEVAIMLRQQQAEIEALKTLLDKGCLDSESYVLGWDDGKSSRESEIEALEQSKDRLIKTLLDVRGQQPIAYINKYADGKETLDNGTDLTAEQSVPLFTYPVKELTDEEIYKIAWNFEEEIAEYASGKWAIPKQDFVDFARAILRKASEK